MDLSRAVTAHTELLARQLELVIAAREDVLGEAWERALVSASQCLGLGQAMVEQAHRAAQGGPRPSIAQVTAIDAHVEARLSQEERRALVLEAAKKLGPILPTEVRAKLDASLEAADSTSPRFADKWARSAPLPADPLLQAGLEAGVQGLLSLAHGSFNRALLDRRGSPANVARLIERVLRTLGHYHSHLADLLSEARATSLGSAGPQAALVARWIRMQIPALATDAARLHHAYRSALEDGQGQLAERHGSALARLTMLSRELMAMHAAMERLASCGSSLPPELAELERRLGQLSLAQALPHGRDVTLAHLSEGIGRVEVAGVAKEVTTSRSDEGRLKSHVLLEDPSSGAKAWLDLDFVHLPHLGVHASAFLQATGEIRPRPGGGLELKVERLALAELAERDWRAALLRLSRRWLRPRPNGLNLIWSWQPQQASEGVRGASELRYGKTHRLPQGERE